LTSGAKVANIVMLQRSTFGRFKKCHIWPNSVSYSWDVCKFRKWFGKKLTCRWPTSYVQLQICVTSKKIFCVHLRIWGQFLRTK
jgi:hypothetical protein